MKKFFGHQTIFVIICVLNIKINYVARNMFVPHIFTLSSSCEIWVKIFNQHNQSRAAILQHVLQNVKHICVNPKRRNKRTGYRLQTWTQYRLRKHVATLESEYEKYPGKLCPQSFCVRGIHGFLFMVIFTFSLLCKTKICLHVILWSTFMKAKKLLQTAASACTKKSVQENKREKLNICRRQ